MRPRRLQDFEGRWNFRREIMQADGTSAGVAGEAVWLPRGACLLQQERGEMRLQGHAPLQAERRYLWEEGLVVRFEDGRYFHRVPPAGGETAHWCDPDQYDGSYDFSGWPAFTVVWRVHGPRKDYRMVTLYRREGP